mmetsp:Transcript_61644/g.133481  ORF Transcript_61644/g.133481 Transcript_61644/m.133481 type:complete len:243 (-) Transcript_61644:1089-1817(-)
MNQLDFCLISSKRRWPLCCFISLLQKPWSEPCGTMHSSSRIAKIPVVLACMMSTASWLSGKSRGSQGMPSLSYSCSSSLKTNWLKNCCSLSLVKLMHNCSKEFILKHSKPKISSTPTKSLTSFLYPMAMFEPFTMKLKTMPYKAFASASRLSDACRTLTGLRIFSVLVTLVVWQRAPSKAFRSTPTSLQTIEKLASHSFITLEPSLFPGGASNFVLPRFNTHATTLKMSCTSAVSMPIVCMA